MCFGAVVSWLICWRLRLLWFKLLVLLWFVVGCSLLPVLVIYVLPIYFDVVFRWFWVVCCVLVTVGCVDGLLWCFELFVIACGLVG